MTDTTDQQAVTVAQEDREAASQFAQAVAELDNPTRFGALAAQAFARHRQESSDRLIVGSATTPAEIDDFFASVSSASADTADWIPSNYSDTPEPVPATNQAGEVERNLEAQRQAIEASARIADVHAEPTDTPDDFTRGYEIAATKIARSIRKLSPNAALATQPATSQPEETWMNDPLSLDAGLPEMSQEAMALICAMAEYSPHVMQAQHGKTVCDDYARAALIAATPTPPTLSEDLPAFVVALEQQMEDQDENLPSSLARERGLVWLEGWFDLRAALAQVKAS